MDSWIHGWSQVTAGLRLHGVERRRRRQGSVGPGRGAEWPPSPGPAGFFTLYSRMKWHNGLT
jgi:hypothetical protein